MSAEQEWRPRPDPAVTDPNRPGLRAHRHVGNTLYGWVFAQDEVWVDYWGNEHEIALMAPDYVANVIAFCVERAAHIHALAYVDALGGVIAKRIANGAAMSVDGETLPLDLCDEPERWLETTPLMAELRRRLAEERS